MVWRFGVSAPGCTPNLKRSPLTKIPTFRELRVWELTGPANALRGSVYRVKDSEVRMTAYRSRLVRILRFELHLPGLEILWATSPDIPPRKSE